MYKNQKKKKKSFNENSIVIESDINNSIVEIL